ncbi:hypothetical protein V9K67_21575 [Paraflavisolibacter sp. H34]|uniref:hypothetical protein n=1 Tax=Huijunlia imazamoxiresistens TaxID=3127457 RepID=UPI00301618D2
MASLKLRAIKPQPAFRKNSDFSPQENNALHVLVEFFSARQISSILKRPINQVKEKIKKLTGFAQTPFARGCKVADKVLAIKEPGRRGRKRKKCMEPSGSVPATPIMMPITAPTPASTSRSADGRKRNQQLATRTIDYSKLVPLQLRDKHNTILYINPAADADQVKKQYQGRHEAFLLSLKPKKKTIRVSNFKPTSPTRA